MTERNRFCQPNCTWNELCQEIKCRHLDDVVYRHPIKATINYGKGDEPITIVGENTVPSTVYNGQPIGQRWYLDDGTAIMYNNPLVKFR